MTRLVNEADIVNKTRPLFTLSLEMTRLVNETRLLLVPGVNLDTAHLLVLVCPLQIQHKLCLLYYQALLVQLENLASYQAGSLKD